MHSHEHLLVYYCLMLFLSIAVVLPADVDHEMVACCIADGVRAYIALQYLGQVAFGDTVLIMDAATSFGSLAVQLAHAWGAKVSGLTLQCELKNFAP